jgi:hypothetical protein
LGSAHARDQALRIAAKIGKAKAAGFYNGADDALSGCAASDPILNCDGCRLMKVAPISPLRRLGKSLLTMSQA